MTKLLVDAVAAYYGRDTETGDTNLSLLRQHYPAFMQKINPTLKKLIRQVIKSLDQVAAPESAGQASQAGPSLGSELTAAIGTRRDDKQKKTLNSMSGTLDDLNDIKGE